MGARKTVVFLLIFTISLNLVPFCFCGNWLENFSYRRIFYWQSNTDNAQDVLTVDYILNQTQPDFEDLRITLNDGETLLPIWNQTTIKLDYCTFWCLFPTANTTYYLYWGNPDAEAVWNQTAIFTVISGVIGAWVLDENIATDALDSSGNGNNGVSTGTTVVMGVYGNGRDFEADDSEYITVTRSEILEPSAITLYVWVKCESTPTAKILSKEDWGNKQGYNIHLESNLIKSFFMDGTNRVNLNSGITPSSSNWYNIISTCSIDGDCYIYINNTEKASDTTTLASLTHDTAENLVFGKLSNSATHYFDGIIDHILIFNYTLTSSERTNLYSTYPDPLIKEGEVFCRVWADSSVTSWGETEIYTTEYSNEEILGITIALIITFFSVALVLTMIKKKKK